MSLIFQTEPAYARNSGVTVTEEGIIVSSIFRGTEPCGLILYHLPDGRSVKVPFTDAHRFGSLYSVKISPLAASEWCYRLYRGESVFVDPCCRSLVEVAADEGKILAGGFYYAPDEKLPPYRPACTRNSTEEFIYVLHVKGFTMLREGLVSCPGTFLAAAEMARYLRDLGVTAVELMPVYELQPDSRASKGPRTMEDALALYPVSRDGFPMRDISKERVNYWGYGKGYYFAPSRSLAATKDAQKEFACLVKALHDAGLEVFLQLYFDSSVPVQTQIDAARFYVTHYRVDGFHLKGNVPSIASFAAFPNRLLHSFWLIFSVSSFP